MISYSRYTAYNKTLVESMLIHTGAYKTNIVAKSSSKLKPNLISNNYNS